MRRTPHHPQQPPSAAATSAAAPIIDNTQLPKPILLKCEEEGTISVRITGFPRPVVRWQIGRKRIKESSKYQMKSNDESSGLFSHSLVIARVTSDLDQGVWVIATNQHGEDCCLLDVKTYSMIVGQRMSNADATADRNDLSGDDPRNGRKKKRRGLSHDTQSIVSLDTYQSEMAHRRRMRSADPLNNSIDAQSAYSECPVSPKPMEGAAVPGSRPPRGSTRVSRRDQLPSDIQHKRYSSTEAVHNELRSSSIPPLSMDDEQFFASASSIPGTPYEERHMPDLAGNSEQPAQKPTKSKKSRRTRSASLTNQSHDDNDNPPRRKKVPRVPKVAVTANTANADLESPEKLKPPLPPTAVRKQTEDPIEVVEVKPRKKKTKKRTTSKSSTASANDTLDKSLEDWDKSPNVTIDQEAHEALKVNSETIEDTSASQPEQLSKATKKLRKRKTSKSSNASGNTLDKSLEDWNRPNQSPDAAVEDQATETQQQTMEPTKLNLTFGSDDNKTDLSTHATDDNKTDILGDDNNNNDLWDLFGMKLNALCRSLLSGKDGTTTDKTKMMNQTNKQKELSPEFIDNEAVVLIENRVEKSPTVANRVFTDSKLNGLILGCDDNSIDKLQDVTQDLGVEIKPPTGQKIKKHTKTLHKESASTIEDRKTEAVNSSHESAVDDIGSRPEIADIKAKENEMKETRFHIRQMNQSPAILLPKNAASREESISRGKNDEVRLNTGEKECNTPTLNFEYDVDASDHESPDRTKNTEVDLMDFDDGHLKVNSWERKELDDITTKPRNSFRSTPLRISLKPAKSEESLVMRTRSETDSGYGRRSELLAGTGRLRVARSVDRLNVDDREASSVPLIKRRSLSKEWHFVTVTTTEEIVMVQKGKNDTKDVDAEPLRDLYQQEENVAKDVDEHVEPAKDNDLANNDINGGRPKSNEIKYIDSEDSMDMDEDFTWPSPPPLPDNEMPPLTKEYAVKQINADVRLVVPITNGSASLNVDQETPLFKPSPPRIESTIRSRIEMLSLFGYDKNPKPLKNTITSETQTSSTVVEPVTPEVPPPLNLDSFPERTQGHSFHISRAGVDLQPSTTVENPVTSITVEEKATQVLGEDEVFSEKGENGVESQTERDTSYDTRSVSQDISTQTDQTDGIDQFKSVSAPPKIPPKSFIQTKAIILENTEKATFELVANSCKTVVTRREEKRDEPEPQNTYYVVEHNECISPVIIHEYGEMLSFCKKQQRSLSDAELNIQKTQQQKLEIQLRLQSLWSQSPQRTTEYAVQKSHEALLSDALSAHLANINAAASSRLAETRATYLLETFRTSPTKDHLTSADAYSSNLGIYSRRPFSDSTL